MVIFELFEVLTVRYSLKIYFKVLTGDRRIKLPLDGMWNVKRWKKSQSGMMLQKKKLPIMTRQSKWKSGGKGHRSRDGFVIPGACSSLKVLPTMGQVQSTKWEPLVKVHVAEMAGAPGGKSLHVWYTGWNFNDMKTQVFLWKGRTVTFFR